MRICVILAPLLFASSSSLHIQLTHDSPAEQHTREQLQRLVSRYDLSKYTFTKEIVIEERSIPHSHPVLTLNTRNLSSDDQLLSSYIHEQLHWYLDSHEADTSAAVNDLRSQFPRVPVGYPDGAADEQSTYIHLIDCYLELRADREILGRERADKAIHAIGEDHYRWVYSTVLRDESAIAAIVRSHHLEPSLR